jgi:hypothetical protein
MTNKRVMCGICWRYFNEKDTKFLDAPTLHKMTEFGKKGFIYSDRICNECYKKRVIDEL